MPPPCGPAVFWETCESMISTLLHPSQAIAPPEVCPTFPVRVELTIETVLRASARMPPPSLMKDLLSRIVESVITTCPAMAWIAPPPLRPFESLITDPLVTATD